MKTCFFTIWPTHVLNFKMETWIMKKKRILSREQKSELQHFQMTWWLKRLTHKGSVKKKKEPRSKKSFLKESIRLRGLKFGFNLVFVFILSGDAKKLPLLVNFQNKNLSTPPCNLTFRILYEVETWTSDSLAIYKPKNTLT